MPRPRETRCAAERSEVSSVVQGPSPRDALSSARLRTLPALRLGHRTAGFRRLFTCSSSPGMSERARPPFTRTVANGGRAYPGLSTSLADFCNLSRRAGTPFERPILARERSFRPAARRHQPMPVALATRCVAASRTSEPRSARDGLRRRVPLAWTSRTAGRSAGVKASRAFFERFARALLFDASGTRVTGSNLREVWRTSRFFAPAETHLGNRLAKGDLFGRVRMPSSATEPLRERRSEPLRARQNRCPVTPPRGEALLGSTVAPLLPLPHRLPLTRKAIEAARPDDPRGNESSTVRRVAAPVTASTIESARGLMCRELHGAFFVQIDDARNKKTTRTMLFFINPLPTGFSTAFPRTGGFSRGVPVLSRPSRACACMARKRHIRRLIV